MGSRSNSSARSRPGSSAELLSVSRSRSRSRTRRTSSGRSRSSTTNVVLNFIAGGDSGGGDGDDYGNGSARSSRERIFSLYKLLMIELNLPTEHNQGRRSSEHKAPADDNSYEELLSMVSIPFYLEQFMAFGLLVSLNSFLTLFTLAPLKIFILSFKTFVSSIDSYVKTSSFNDTRNHFRWVKRDIVTIIVIMLSVIVLSSQRLDISRMYHEVRGLAHIKLYVMFGVLEVADKLCSSLGQDLLNILHKTSLDQKAKFAIFFVLSVFYLSFHAYILIYQTVSLNVAANSYSNALLALLLSNQFAELKSSVFKKFEREGLFQLSMSDLTERFQLSLMLSIIALKNLLQLSGSNGLIPNSWRAWNTWFGAILGPGVVVIGSEIFVDWLKHCYITKFNKVRPRVYRNFLYVLSLDFLQVFKVNPTKEPTSLHQLVDYVVLTRRIGLPILASIVCFLRMTLPDLKQIFLIPVTTSYTYSIFGTLSLILVAFFTLLLIRLILGLILLKVANKIKREHQQYQEMLKSSLKVQTSPPQKTDTVSLNGLDVTLDIPQSTPSPIQEHAESPKSPIDSSFLPGIPNTEVSSINPSTRSYLYDFGEKVPPTVEEKRNKDLLKDLTENDEAVNRVNRYEMVSKRIW